MRHRVSSQRPQVGLAVRMTMWTAVASVPLRGRGMALGVACLLLGAVGGEVVRAQSDHGQQPAEHDLNVLPERFEDRLLFPVEEQAVAMARRGLELPHRDADLSRGALAGVQPMPRRQLVFRPLSATRGEVADTLARRFDDPVTIRLSKFRYPWEDGHLDATVWTTPPEEGRVPGGSLEVILKDGQGVALARHELAELSPHGLFFSVGFPEALRGGAGTLEVVWREADVELGRAEAAFHVHPPNDAPRSDRVPLRILNEPGATIRNAPMTVGVPFPRGALGDQANVRLVDANGVEMGLQTRVTARWSRFGPVKWLLCDFTIDLDGEPREVYLEYGPDVRRGEAAALGTGELVAGFPALDAGRVRVGKEGLSFDAAGDGDFRPVLGPRALLGAFVTHEDGRTYSMPADAEYAFEELGSEKAVVRRTGWYTEQGTGDRFCNFVTRFVFHRDSPVVRIFHTWIFTGDGNRDRVANMGWRFDAAQPVHGSAFLNAFEDGAWISAASLVQFDYQTFLLPKAGSEQEGRTPGVLSALVGDTRATFGAKDFWQNFPSELEVGAEGFTFYNWPRRNPPARMESPVAREDAFRHRFVHEGELLDFRIPDEYADGPIWRESSSREGHWAEGRPETANAQGIARTEEMFLYFADASASADDAARVIQGLNDETLRAVADPAWVCASGVFGDMHPRDPEDYPEEERIAELALIAPARWVERLGFYGMWLHGDYPGWGINLEARTASTYRTLRKNHKAFPYRWTPFARSGDPRMLKLAEKAVRQMTDANFCHYATAEVDESVGPDHFRRQGWWDRSLLPWAGRRGPHLRSYTVDCDYLWEAYYMTGYGRARDIALLFGELTQRDHAAISVSMPGRTRPIESMLTSYIDMYQATFDPWFLASLHEIADLKAHLYGAEEPVDKWTPWPDDTGHTWRSASQRLYQFTGEELHRHMALNNAMAWASPRSGGARRGGHAGGWGVPRVSHSSFAWSLTGDEFYLRRAAASVDVLNLYVYEGETDYLRGTQPNIFHGRVPFANTFSQGWGGLGHALSLFERAGRRPEPLHDPFLLGGSLVSREDGAYRFSLPSVYMRKDGPQAVPVLLDALGRGRGPENGWPQPQYGPYSYEVLDREGETVVEGEWRAPDMVEIPANAPQGAYRVDVFGNIPYPDEDYLLENWGPDDLGAARSRFERRHNRVFFPLGKFDTPEVMAFEPSPGGTSVDAPGVGYHFMVPEGTEEFWIEFRRSGDGRAPINRISVWNPDGERVYDHSYTGGPPDRVTIEVPPEHRGQVWRATGGTFTVDPQIPPYFSLTQSKWFDPEE